MNDNANGGDLDLRDPVRDIEVRVLSRALENGVQVKPGSLFDTGEKMAGTAIHFRLTYAAANEAELEEGVKKLASAVREEFCLEAAC